MSATVAATNDCAMELELHKRQSLAFGSPATEILYGGAAGGGKSHLLRVAAISWAYDMDGLQVYLFRRTHPDLFKNHMEGPTGFPSLLAAWVDNGFASINYSKNYIDIGASRIHLCHCQHEKDVYKYQGAEIHVLMMDELTHFSRSQYAFLRSRVRLGGFAVPERYKGMFPRIVTASNPGGVGHNWVKAEFVDRAPAMRTERAPKGEGGMLRQFIPAKLEDNPTLVENDPEYGDRLEGLGNPALVRAMRTGDWDIVAGGMFDDVWDRSVHVLTPFGVPPSWRIDRAFDYGSSRPFSVGWWAESDGTALLDGRSWPRGTLFRVGEWYGWNGRPNEGAKLSVAEIGAGIVARERELGIHGRVQPGPGDCPVTPPGQEDVRDGLAKAGAKFTEPKKASGSRETGWQLMRDRLSASRATPMEAPGLFVFDTCTHFLRTIPVLPRDERKPDDVDTDAEDHVADEARYRLLAKRKSLQTAEWVRY